jgi:polyisoprenoid-binding protein YceI
MKAIPSGEWVIDYRHVSVIFRVQHLIVARVRGRFDTIRGTLSVPADPAASRLEVVIEAASVNTGNAFRDKHLRSADFLDVENHAELTYTAASMRPGGEPDQWVVEGDLRLRGVTRPVPLDMVYLGATTDVDGPVIAFTAKAELDRTEFGVIFNRPLSVGGFALGNAIEIEIEVEFIAPEALAIIAKPRH